MKHLYYFEGINKYGPYTEEELVSKQLNDDILIVDYDTNESIRYVELKKRMSIDCQLNNSESHFNSLDTDIDKSKKHKFNWKLTIKIVVGLLILTEIVLGIFVVYAKNRAEEAARELFIDKNGQIKKAIVYNTYEDGEFSFQYPSSFTLTDESILNDRHLLCLQNNDNIIMVTYSLLSRDYSIQEKQTMITNELDYNVKKAMYNIDENVQFEDIVAIINDELVLKYRMDFKILGIKGSSVSAIGSIYGYTITFITTDYYFDIINECVNQIEIK